jgi:hypothetical protein
VSGTAIAAAGIPVSHIDQVAVAVRHILAANPRLAAWASGGIHRAEALAEPYEGIAAPNIIVSALSEDGIFEPGEGWNMSLPIGIVLTWESPIAWLDDDDPTIAAVMKEIQRTLCDRKSYHLEVPQSAGRRLIRKLYEFRPISYEAIKEVAGSPVTLRMMFVADYRVLLNTSTWEIMPS